VGKFENDPPGFPWIAGVGDAAPPVPEVLDEGFPTPPPEPPEPPGVALELVPAPPPYAII
jgi:hypothetical protein